MPAKFQRTLLSRSPGNRFMRLALAGAGFWLVLFAAQTLTALAQDSAGREVVHFASADAAATGLSGLLMKPAGKGPFPAFVMLHGCSGMLTKSGKLKKRPTFWSNWLVQRGFLVLLADSFTPRGHGSICGVEKRPVKPDRERPYDIYGALEYLLARPDVRPGRIFLMGWSNGAMSMLWAIGKDAPARPKALAHDFRAAIGFYPGCVQLSKTAYSTQIPVLLQLGSADDWTPAKPCLRLIDKANKAGSDMRADVHANAYHNFDHPSSTFKTITTRNSIYKKGFKEVHAGSNPQARDAAVANVAAFLDAQLKPAGAGK